MIEELVMLNDLTTRSMVSLLLTMECNVNPTVGDFLRGLLDLLRELSRRLRALERRVRESGKCCRPPLD